MISPRFAITLVIGGLIGLALSHLILNFSNWRFVKNNLRKNYPWNWRVLMGPVTYFNWLIRLREREVAELTRKINILKN